MNPRKPVILCVDDEEANLKLLENILVPRGYAVVGAASGKDALRKIKSLAVDLVLLDVIMPGMDGFDVCRQIKEDQKLKDIPIIMITALTAMQDHVRGIEAGADEFLAKPIEKMVALARIKALLKLKELNDERQRAEAELQKSHDELECKVQERTAELVQANELLHADISKRIVVELQKKAALEALRRSEENFRRSLDESPLGVRIVTAEGETLYANRAIVDIYGYDSIEELKGAPLKNIYTPESYAEFKIRKEKRERNEFGPSEYEISIVRKNREVRQVHVFRKEIFWNGARQFQVVYQDITERKKTEKELLIIKKAVESSSDSIGISDPQGHHFYHNKAFSELFEYTPEELEAAGGGPAVYANNDIAGEVFNAIMAGRSWSGELEMISKSGRKIPFLLRADAIKDESGKIIGLIGLHTDITERKRAEESILASLAEKEVLLKEVHHRVKNNLMTIIGLINMQETKAHNKMFNPLLQELEGRVRAMALVHESLHKSEDLAHVNLQNYVESMSAHIRAQFGAERDIRFTVRAAGAYVNLDIAVPCGLILNELIANAYKHAFPGDKPRAGADKCEINVTVGQEDGVLTLTVADNGVGLPEGTNWENPETTGLQLIKMLSHQINGSLDLERSAGTVYHLKFPRTVP